MLLQAYQIDGTKVAFQVIYRAHICRSSGSKAKLAESKVSGQQEIEIHCILAKNIKNERNPINIVLDNIGHVKFTSRYRFLVGCETGSLIRGHGACELAELLRIRATQSSAPYAPGPRSELLRNLVMINSHDTIKTWQDHLAST